MKNKKNLKNLGFTLVEALSVIAIFALICSIAIPIGASTFRKYQSNVFLQKCIQYENCFVKKHNYFSYGRNGTTALTKSVTIKIPITKKITKEEEIFVDMLDTTSFEYFVYETLVESGFKYENYNCVYSPASIESKYSFSPSVFSIFLEDDIRIDFHLNILSTAVGANQVAYIEKVVLSNDVTSYEFEV